MPGWAVPSSAALSRREVRLYHEDGCLFPVRGLLSPEDLAGVDSLLTALLRHRPQGLAPEDLLNLHTTCREVLDLCKHPRCLSAAAQLLGTENVSVFTSRILCKGRTTNPDPNYMASSRCRP